MDATINKPLKCLYCGDEQIAAEDMYQDVQLYVCSLGHRIGVINYGQND